MAPHLRGKKGSKWNLIELVCCYLKLKKKKTLELNLIIKLLLMLIMFDKWIFMRLIQDKEDPRSYHREM